MVIKPIVFIVSLLCCFFPFSPARASLQISNIPVHIKSDSGLKARDLALADARRKAFLSLLKNNPTLSYDIKANGLPTDEALEAAVDTFEIEKEKISAKQYVGTLSITFSDQGLEKILQASPSAPAKPQQNDFPQDASSVPPLPLPVKKDVILLPLYVTSDESLLWQTGNPWHTFWQTPPQDDTFKTLLPLGDVQDIMGTSIEDIMTNQHQRIHPLLNRYGKDELVVAILKRLSTDQPLLELTVKLFHRDRLVFSSDPLLIDEPTLENGLRQAHFELIQLLQDQSTSQSSQKNTALQTYSIRAQFNSFAEWQQIRRGLQTLSPPPLTISGLSRTSGHLILNSYMSFEALVQHLSPKGLALEEGIPGTFMLYVTKPLTFDPSLNKPLAPPASKKAPKIRSAFETSF